jgi:hypothetical protein
MPLIATLFSGLGQYVAKMRGGAGVSVGPTDPPSSSTESKQKQKSDEKTDDKKRSWRERLLSVPGAIAGLVVAGVISTACAYYLPGLFSQASTAAPPLVFNVLDNTAAPFTMIMPQARIADGAPGGGCSNFRPWVISQDGEDARMTSLSLVVQGNTSVPVYIYGVRAEVLSRDSPAKGAVVNCPTAGYVTQRPVAINLDTSGDGRYVTKAADSPFGFTVSQSDLEVFSIAATTTQCNCTWDLQVEAVVNGQDRQFTVTDHGRPFETSAYSQSAVEYEWNYSNAWYVMQGQRQLGQFPAGSAPKTTG